MKKFKPLCSRSLRSKLKALSLLYKLLLILSLTTLSLYADQQLNKPPALTPSLDLEKGKIIERQITGGEIHAYSLRLENREYVALQIRQQGIDVTAMVINPSGVKLAEIDGQYCNSGIESVVFIAETAGLYQLNLRATEKEVQKGGYTIQLVEQRASSARDNKLIAANSAFDEGRLRLRSDQPEALRAAIATIKKALEIFTAEGDLSMQVQALITLGRASHTLIERKQARGYFEQALSLSRKIGDRNLEADALAGVATASFGIFYDPRWLESLSQALQIKKETGDQVGQAHILNSIAALYYGLNNYQQSLEYRYQALALYRNLGHKAAEFNTLLAVGTALNSLGERQRSIDYFQQALALSHQYRNQGWEAEALAKIGGVYYAFVDYPTALKYYKQALPLSQAAKDRYTESGLLSGIGSAYLAMGQYSEAHNFLKQAMQIAAEEGKPELEIGVLRNLALAEGYLGEPEKARDYFKHELQLVRAMGSRSAEALTVYVWGEFERDQGNYEAALELLSAGLKIRESFLSNIFARELRASSFARIRAMYEVYTDTLMLMHKRNPEKKYNEEALRISEMTRVRSLVEILGESQSNILEGVDAGLLETERRVQQQINAKADDLFQLQLNKTDDEQLQKVTRELNELTAKAREIEYRIRTTAPHYIALTRPTTLCAKEIQEQILDDDTVLLEYMLGRKRSYVWAVTKDSINSYELNGQVGIGLATQNVYKQLTARNKCVQFETVEERQERITQADQNFRKAAAELSRMLLAPVAKHLSKKRLLIVCDSALQYIPFAALPSPNAGCRKPVAGEGTSINEQNRQPKGAGFATADAVVGGRQAADYRTLSEEHEIVNLPSASTLAMLRQELAGRESAAKILAIFGDPVFDKSDIRLQSTLASTSQRLNVERSQMVGKGKESPVTALTRLPFTRKEVETISALVPANQKRVALDFESNRTAATDSSLSQYRYIHFATHAVVDSARPELSGIALSRFNKYGQEQESFLRLNDIFNLRLPAELVVLSGCSTGLGRELRGEGLIGLTRGFMYAGAARVMVSLWDVNDEATAEFMTRFYRAMLVQKLTPAAALKTTQTSMAKDKRWSAPYYWAAFVLQGEPQ
jgi:CHAT domain-containing protein